MLVLLEKKANTVKCEEHRMVSLTAHTIQTIAEYPDTPDRVKSGTFPGFSSVQFSFRRGRGTQEAIVNIRLLGERSIEHGREVYACIVDYDKVLDGVPWVKFLNLLTQNRVDWRDQRLIVHAY